MVHRGELHASNRDDGVPKMALHAHLLTPRISNNGESHDDAAATVLLVADVDDRTIRPRVCPAAPGRGLAVPRGGGRHEALAGDPHRESSMRVPTRRCPRRMFEVPAHPPPGPALADLPVIVVTAFELALAGSRRCGRRGLRLFEQASTWTSSTRKRALRSAARLRGSHARRAQAEDEPSQPLKIAQHHLSDRWSGRCEVFKAISPPPRPTVMVLIVGESVPARSWPPPPCTAIRARGQPFGPGQLRALLAASSRASLRHGAAGDCG